MLYLFFVLSTIYCHIQVLLSRAIPFLPKFSLFCQQKSHPVPIPGPDGNFCFKFQLTDVLQHIGKP